MSKLTQTTHVELGSRVKKALKDVGLGVAFIGFALMGLFRSAARFKRHIPNYSNFLNGYSHETCTSDGFGHDDLLCRNGRLLLRTGRVRDVQLHL